MYISIVLKTMNKITIEDLLTSLNAIKRNPWQLDSHMSKGLNKILPSDP